MFRHESLIGSRFDARVESATELADGTPAVYPNIEGRAFITSHSGIMWTAATPIGTASAWKTSPAQPITTRT